MKKPRTSLYGDSATVGNERDMHHQGERSRSSEFNGIFLLLQTTFLLSSPKHTHALHDPFIQSHIFPIDRFYRSVTVVMAIRRGHWIHRGH